MAGCGAYTKIDGFAILPVMSFSMAFTTFISQNMGAQKLERVKKGAHFGIVCSLILAEVVGISIYILAPFLISMFDQTKEVVAFGTAQARSVTLFYFLLAFSHCISWYFKRSREIRCTNDCHDGLLVLLFESLI